MSITNKDKTSLGGIKELRKLIKMLREEGVYSFKDNGLELAIYPQETMAVDISASKVSSDEDDLFYSAD